MNVFEPIGTAAIAIGDPADLSIAERHALDHLLADLGRGNRDILASDRRRERDEERRAHR
jgi:hypothetical protein